MREKLFSALFWVFVALSCFICFGIAVVLWLVTLPFDRDRRLNHLFSCAWAYLYAIAYPGWRVTVLNRHLIKSGEPYVLVANHTSIADVVLCFCLMRQFKWVSKKEVFQTPFLGWNMWLSRYIPLKRGRAESIREMMATCRHWLQQRHMSIMMFPEGTRSKDGTVQKFKRGAFDLAMGAGVSVVPVAIHGGHLLIPKNGKVFAAQAHLVVEVLEPLASSSFSSVDEFAEATRERIVKALEKNLAVVAVSSPSISACD